MYSVFTMRSLPAWRIANAVCSTSSCAMSPLFMSHNPSVSPSIISAPMSAAASNCNCSLGLIALKVLVSDDECWYICAKTTGFFTPAIISWWTKARWSPSRFWWLVIQTTTTSGWVFRHAKNSSEGVPYFRTRNFTSAFNKLMKGIPVTGKIG